MHDSLKALSTLSRLPQGCGLATVTAVEGSSYRRPGARLVLAPDGTRFGSISGGCLEEDLLLHLRQVMNQGTGRTLMYDTTEENDLVWGVGLGCHGRVTLLLERIDAAPPSLHFIEEASNVRRSGAVLATVYAAGRPECLGPALAVAADGAVWQADTPGRRAEHLTAPATAALAARASAWRHFPELTDQPSVFFEYIPPASRLVILGAGDDARPLARLATELGWSVTVADPRPAFATRERFPTADEVLAGSPVEVAGRITFDDHTFAVVMTHHYVHDLPFLRSLLPLALPYLGLLGPRKRAEKLLADLRAEGLDLTAPMLAGLHAPVGLDLGGDTPEAVALSMLAEMQAVRESRNGQPLRHRTHPIHG